MLVFGLSNLKIRHKVWETLFVYIFFTLYPDFFRGNYLEYRVRKALRDRGEYYIQPNGQKSTRPSVRTILEVLETVLIIYFNGNLYLPNDTSPKILKMLEWLGFSPDIYTKKINVIF